MDNNKILSGLYEIRAKLLNNKTHYENKLSIINDEINDINKKICEYEGHEFSQWIDAEDYCFGYVRYCEKCGEVEHSLQKPITLIKK